MDDLRLPSCLSPLDQPTLNDSTDQSNTIQTQPSFHRRPWLTVNPGSLQFPLSAITHKANKSASFPQHTKHSCLFNPQNWGTRAALCTGKEVEERGAISASHQNVTELKSAPRKIKCEQGDTKGDAVAPKRRKRKCTSHPQEASSVLAFKCMKVSDETQDLRVCSVSLSSSNVLAKEREITAGSSNIPNKVVGKPNEPSTITDNLNEKTRVPRGLKSDPQTRIRTRGFLKKTQETPSNASIEDSALKPATPRAQIVNKEGVPKRGRGRPQKTKVEKSPPENSPALVEKKSQDVNREAQINRNLLEEEESEQNKRKSKKLRKNRGVEAIPLKKTRSAESTVKAVADDNNEVIPAGRKLGTPKQPQMVNLKEFQKLIKHQHSKAGRAKEMQEQESNETSRAVESEGNACGSRVEELPKETEMDIAQPQNRDGIKSTCGYLKSQRDDRNGSASEDTSLLVDESHPVFSVDVLGEDVSTLAAEREQPSKNPDEGVLDTTQHHAITDESSSHSDTHLPQQDEIPLNYNLNPQTPESTAPPLSDAVGFSKSSGCDQGETKEEEDVDVDVLIYSPDQVPQTGECENRLDCIEITPEEEEEEDVTEVDVTGDEAEFEG
ncbi:uncharacterized protein LOC115013599 isoform X1 [Cottoperca gobio]|uniref:Uncharacterized protein LOC115013599 isoform X1 n=1 Tax=Cottoperca gobio TaxID=56716 RepID=A0A6J2QER0_COTGO|nr:BTB/POZ domain-containing protein 18 isoform X1 [Cottoperca gobio]